MDLDYNEFGINICRNTQVKCLTFFLGKEHFWVSVFKKVFDSKQP